MVSKPKRSKSSPATHHLRRRKKTPIATATKTASVVVASINKSIYTCHRRLIKIFSNLVRIATPKTKSSVKKGYKVLKKVSVFDDQIVSVRRSLFQETKDPLPPLTSPNQKTVFLDLDETLIHSVPANGLIRPRNYDFVVKPLLDGERVVFYVTKRPFVDEFLEFLSENGFEIVVFTAGIEEYASLVLNVLDRKGLISHRLFRDSCREFDGKYVKDLSNVGRDLKNGVIVDDNPNSYSLQPENAIPIRPFVDDVGDEELKKLMNGFFAKCCEFDDLRDAVKSYVGNGVEELKSVEKLVEDEMFGNSMSSNLQALIEV
ncbi:hypothetical protein QVD17_20185 [Tagetes erecta]|uniref:FCP1 homology domain-containing protein n=1 Tax=Tagetes erecta TaxID=13708 RepID=A0AAD8NXZ2_TARER|nr:hypothetical protein QVD17_20185 [Tagetes erecta]